MIASIRNDIDMTDPFYEQERAFYDANMPIFRNLLVDYQMRIYHSPHRAYMEEKLGHVAFKKHGAGTEGGRHFPDSPDAKRK